MVWKAAKLMKEVTKQSRRGKQQLECFDMKENIMRRLVSQNS